MGKDNEDEEKDLESSEDDIPIAALEAVDLSLPDDYMDEIFANQLLNTIGSYHTCQAERRSLRHIGDNAKAELMSKQVAAYRSQAALIQHEYPNTVALYKELATVKVKQAKEARVLMSLGS